MPVEMTTAQAAPSRSTPTGKGTSCFAAKRTTFPPALGTLMSMRPGTSLSLLKAKTAMTTTTVSTKIVPTVHQATAFFGVLPDLAL